MSGCVVCFGTEVRKLMRKWFWIACLVIVSGCGRKKPVIVTPTEGAVFPYGQVIQVTLEEFDDQTTISFRGKRPPELQCQDSIGTAYCTWTYVQQQTSYNSQTSYTLIAVATHGDESSFVSFEVQVNPNGNQLGGPQPPR